jgi:hypothetical protein
MARRRLLLGVCTIAASLALPAIVGATVVAYVNHRRSLNERLLVEAAAGSAEGVRRVVGGADVNCGLGDASPVPWYEIRRIVPRDREVCDDAVWGGNTSGCTPLMLAVASGNGAAVDVLLAAGADVNTQTIDGMTALMWAARGGRQFICERLMRAGASTKGVDREGLYATDHAERSTNPELARWLLRRGAPLGRGCLLNRMMSGRKSLLQHRSIGLLISRYPPLLPDAPGKRGMVPPGRRSRRTRAGLRPPEGRG